MDGLKAINDEGGHLAGDQALAFAAAAWRNVIPACATLGRLGGDEFGVVFPAMAKAETTCTVDALRHAARPYRASVGVAEFDGCESARTLLARADEALYAAKRSGRNRTHVAEIHDVRERLTEAV